MIRYVAYALMGLLIVSGVLATKTVYAQKWYPGENVEQGLFVKYRIAHFDYKRGTPFEATLWFGSQDDKGNWIVDVIATETGKVATGQIKLSSLTLTPIGFPSDELKPYQAPIKDSLTWLGSYASESKQRSLVSGAWGVIAAIGGGSIIVQPVGTETIEAAGKSWDTYVIGWRYGIDSKVWVADNFPLPIQAKVFAFTTQQPIPVQFEFKLLETGISETSPEPPEATLELPTPPLSMTTTTAKFKVDLYWEPVEIKPGESTKFGVVIFGQRGDLMDVRYKLKIEDAKGNVVMDDEFLAKKGQGTHELTLEEAGSLDVCVIVLGSPEEIAGGGGLTQFREEACFELVVVPEFPIGIALVMASLVAMMVAITRFGKIRVPKL